MIHNNFRKLVKKAIGVSRTSLRFVDISGYIGTSSDTITNSTAYKLNVSSSSQWSSTNYASISTYGSSDNYKGVPFAVIGHSIESNEPDYTLGEIRMDNVVITTTATTDTNLVLATTLVNQGNSDIEFDEVALFNHCWGGSSDIWNGASNPRVNFMLIKEVLSEPLTLGAGESISIAFNLFGDVTISEA